MRLITEARSTGGRFTGLFDFAARVDLRRLGKRALEKLAAAGALDELYSNRRKVFESLEALMAYSATAHEDRISAQVSLFGEATDALPAPRLPQPDDWSPMERLAQEHGAVGFYLSGHPLDDYRAALRRERIPTHADLVRQAAGTTATVARLAGTVASLDQRKSARGNRFAFVRLSDPSGSFEVRMFSDVLDTARDHLAPGQNLVVTVEAVLEGEELKLLAKAAQPIDQALAGAASAGLRVYLNDAAAAPSLAARLATGAREVSTRRRGPVALILMHPDLPGEVEVALPEPYPLTPQALGAIKTVQGVVHIEEF
jgi:DNA polymerase-3 subunit alpha